MPAPASPPSSSRRQRPTATRCSSRVRRASPSIPRSTANVGYTPRDLLPITKVTTSPLVLAVNADTDIRSLVAARGGGEEGTGQAQLLDVGQRIGAASCDVALHAAHRHADDARALQGRRAGDRIGDGGRDASHVRHLANGAAAGEGRHAARPGGEHARAIAARAGSSRHARSGFPEYNLEFWYGIFAPACTPPAVVKKIFDATVAAMQQPSVKAILAREGTDVSLSASPEAYASFLVEDEKVLGGPREDSRREDRVKTTP